MRVVVVVGGGFKGEKGTPDFNNFKRLNLKKTTYLSSQQDIPPGKGTIGAAPVRHLRGALRYA